MKKYVATVLPALMISGLSMSPVMASGYILDSDGKIVKDQFGGCTRDTDWKQDIETCGGPVSKPVVAEPVAVEKPAPKPKAVAKPAPIVVAAVPVAVDDAPASFLGLFATDKSQLTDNAKAQLDVYAEYLAKHTQKNLLVSGHTDATGTEDYNLALSQRRADAVKNYLVAHGVAEERISTVAMGESSPIADNATPEGRAQNRRVVFEMMGAD